MSPRHLERRGHLHVPHGDAGELSDALLDEPAVAAAPGEHEEELEELLDERLEAELLAVRVHLGGGVGGGDDVGAVGGEGAADEALRGSGGGAGARGSGGMELVGETAGRRGGGQRERAPSRR